MRAKCGNIWEHVATCVHLKQILQNVWNSLPFCENPICPDQVWKPVNNVLPFPRLSFWLRPRPGRDAKWSKYDYCSPHVSEPWSPENPWKPCLGCFTNKLGVQGFSEEWGSGKEGKRCVRMIRTARCSTRQRGSILQGELRGSQGRGFEHQST